MLGGHGQQHPAGLHSVLQFCRGLQPGRQSDARQEKAVLMGFIDGVGDFGLVGLKHH